jgi:hypothetical protein
MCSVKEFYVLTFDVFERAKIGVVVVVVVVIV